MENFELVLNEMFAGSDSAIAKDLKLNLKKYLFESNLSRKEAFLVTFSLSSVLKLDQFKTIAKEILQTENYTDAQFKEAEETGAFMGMLNTYYKFKNFSSHVTSEMSAGLRMNALAKHALDVQEFELLALAHSLANSCEYCVKAHEQVLMKQNVSLDKIHDTARLTSILKGVSLFAHH